MSNTIILVVTSLIVGFNNLKPMYQSSKENLFQSEEVVENQPGKPAVTFKDVEPLLQKYTCIVCHTESKKLIGPSYKDIAKRKYTDERILQLIYKPEPSNWPDYPAPMVPMTNVKKVDGLKIAAWINSLN
ncbi:MAG TPA: hypothetical protein PKD85_14570 [Saprospiraceae bacterium]|nr:hypothetical protein [Saprospiraceae bacterium]